MRLLPPSTQMYSPAPWFGTLVTLLLALLLFLRTRFPAASPRAETVVLVATALLFFGLCSVFLPRASRLDSSVYSPPAPVPIPLIPTSSPPAR
jgi:hypothetical protein